MSGMPHGSEGGNQKFNGTSIGSTREDERSSRWGAGGPEPRNLTPKSSSDQNPSTFAPLATFIGLSSVALFGAIVVKELLTEAWQNHVERKHSSIAVMMDRNHRFYGALNKDSKSAYADAQEACKKETIFKCQTVRSSDDRAPHCLAVAAKHPFKGDFIVEQFDDVKKETLSKRLREEFKKPYPEFVSVSYFCNTPQLQASVEPLAIYGIYLGPHKSTGKVLTVFNDVEKSGSPKMIYRRDACVHVTSIPSNEMFQVTYNNAGAPASGYVPQHQVRPAPECR